MNIAISGIGGFIGKRVAERALSKGYSVKGMDKDAHVVEQIKKELFVESFVGNITNENDCLKLCKEADVVLHTAALVKEEGNWDVFRQVNVQGTLNMAKSAKEFKVRHFIHISSVMVYGFDYPPHCIEETNLKGDNNPYCTTKIEAEKAILPLGDDTFGITIIRPGDVYGPGSIPWVIRPLEMKASMQFVLPDDGKGVFNSLYIDNLVDALFLCIEEQAYGKIYNVTDDAPVTNKEYFSTLFSMAGAGSILYIPKSVLYPISSIAKTVFGYFNKESEVNPQAIRYLLRPHSYSCRKIKEELDYYPKIALAEGMKITYGWLKQSRPDLLDT